MLVGFGNLQWGGKVLCTFLTQAFVQELIRVGAGIVRYRYEIVVSKLCLELGEVASSQWCFLRPCYRADDSAAG